MASPQLRNMGTVGGNLCQEPRCWYYRYPGDYFDCIRKGGSNCNALTGENHFHSIFGSVDGRHRPCSSNCPGNGGHPLVHGTSCEPATSRRAARILLEKNPLPAITGRVCPHYCEQNCNRDLYDEAVSVRSVERYLGDYVLDHADEMLPPASATGGLRWRSSAPGRPVLSCAFYLRRAGHPVTVFEKMPEAGGMLRYGIPAYRLSHRDRAPAGGGSSRSMGVEFRFGVEVGKDIPLDEAARRSRRGVRGPRCLGPADAWAWRARSCSRPGLPFLAQVKEGLRDKPGDKVVVIGGGNVAVDVALTAKRLGAAERHHGLPGVRGGDAGAVLGSGAGPGGGCERLALVGTGAHPARTTGG